MGKEIPFNYHAGWIVKKNQPWKEGLDAVLRSLVIEIANNLSF